MGGCDQRNNQNFLKFFAVILGNFIIDSIIYKEKKIFGIGNNIGVIKSQLDIFRISDSMCIVVRNYKQVIN